MKYIVVGGNAAGMSAASKLRRLQPQAEITVLERGPDVSYGSCGIPYYFGGEIPDLGRLTARPLDWFSLQNISVSLKTEVLAIKPADNLIEAVSAQGNFKHEYDKLILATGASPRTLDIPGTEFPNVLTIRTLDDARKLETFLTESGAAKVCIIGAGYIGVEMAENLVQRGLDVTLLQRGSQILTGLDPQIIGPIHQHITAKGVDLRLEAQALALEGNDRVQEVVTAQGKIATDLVLITAGIQPDSQLAIAAGLDVDDRGAIIVDQYLQTSDPDILAAGDCARHWHQILEDWTWIPLGDTANKMGRLAGVNAAGGQDVFPGVLGTAAVKVFDLHAAHTGLGLKAAKDKFAKARAVQITSGDIAGYYPGVSKLTCRLIVAEDGRILGCQAMGGSAKAVELVNIAAAALANGMRAEDLSWLDLAYAPPYSPVWHPLLIAASQAAKN